MTRRDTQSESAAAAALVPLPAAVDLIRFEKNLLQIGFFGAHDTRHNNLSTRRIEQWVNRNGQKIKVAAEFRGSGSLGLPSTSDRDKYIAFMKIAMDQRAKMGRLENPIRFTGYHMLKELGLTYSGENYEDINRWGQRMADTTITSEQVIYLAARKRYVNKTVHVFRSFLRAGQSDHDGAGTTRAEHYEIVLEDWLLENLNQSYVIPEDFNAYRRLKRPTAKGIFGYLHLWFHASQGRPVEKDYSELCMLLNIPVYKHVSKIKETMGRSLDELAGVGYLSSWDIRPMITKEGFKLVLLPGDELANVLAISRRKVLADSNEAAAAAASGNTPLDALQQEAAALLQARGIGETKAQQLVRRLDPEMIIDQIEYADYLASRDRRGKIENPAGLLIYSIENRIPVPANFVTSRKTRRQQDDDGHRIRLEESFDAFVRERVDDELHKRFPGGEFDRRVRLVVNDRIRRDDRFAQMEPEHQKALAEQFLRVEIRDSLPLPTLEEWAASSEQMNLF